MRRGRGMARRRVGVAAALAMLLVGAACGGSDSKPDASAVASRTEESTASTEERTATSGKSASSTADKTITRKIDRTGWYDGFAITVDEVEVTEDSTDTATLTVTATYRNLTDRQGRPPSPLFEIDGEIISLSSEDLPELPGKGKAGGSLVAYVDLPGTPDELIDATTLVYGESGDNQTKLPLSANGKVESSEPKDLAVTGTLKQGQLIIDVLGGRLAPSYESGEKGKAILDLRIKISCAADCQDSGYNTDASQFSVSGPGGRSVVADSRSLYCCDAIYPGTVSDNANILSFVVPAPGTGSYTLTYDNETITSTGTPPATLTFTA